MDAKAKRLTLIACILGTVVVFVDGTIVNVALPKSRADLGVGLSAQHWIIEGGDQQPLVTGDREHLAGDQRHLHAMHLGRCARDKNPRIQRGSSERDP